LAVWLKTEAGRSRKQRRTLKQLHAGFGPHADERPQSFTGHSVRFGKWSFLMRRSPDPSRHASSFYRIPAEWSSLSVMKARKRDARPAAPNQPPALQIYPAAIFT
jgi:hypothetical protein